MLTRPQTFTQPIPISTLTAQVRLFETRFNIAENGPSVTVHLLSLLESIGAGGKQVHDTHLVATMIARGITELVTNNPSDFARFAHLITVTPLVQETYIT